MSSQPHRVSALFPDLPDFENITVDSIGPMTEALLGRLRADVDAMTNIEDPTFDSLVVAVEQLQHELARCWSPVSHLNMVSNTPQWQEAYLHALSDVTAFSSELAQNAAIYAGYDRIASRLTAAASDEQRRVIEHALRDFRLSGIALDDEGQQRYRELMQALSAAQATFSSNLQRCTDAWQWHTSHDVDVAGLPASVLRQARQAAQEAGRDGWLFGLTQPVYQAVITHATSRNTRARFYRAWMTRASDTGDHDPGFDNSGLIREILAARRELAELLGFESYADYSLAAKMAGSVDEVLTFLRDLCERSMPSAVRELNTLTLFAGHELAPWDVAHYSERLREQTFAISDENVRPYFPAERALQGLFALAQRLFGITLSTLDDVATWHADAQFVQVSQADGSVIGGFYTDLFARPGKRSGAWIDECIVRKALPGTFALPVGYLVCNFSPADTDTPALLTHNELVTLFHEFGHMLHHLLTRVSFPSIAGINGVPWDAVELPSQFMEHFAWHYDVLRDCSGHYISGEPLPRELFDKLHASRNASAGLQMLRQLEFALFDFELHARKDADADGVVREVLAAARDAATLVPVPGWNRFENGFAHIFAGGYAAGYYSYKWAEVLAADAFSAFDDAGSIFDNTVATRFREHILEVGGSRDIQQAFVAFRGREATIDALLLNHGIIAA